MPSRVTPVISSRPSDNLSRFSRVVKRVCLTVLAAACIGASSVSAQQQQSPSAAANTADIAAGQSSEFSSETPPSDRQLQIAQQSAGLLQMAKDLKAALDATTIDSLSVAAFRKADAIERFTQTLKDQNKHPNRKP